jgi:hypothetical protein
MSVEEVKTVKFCNVCQTDKPVELFGKDKSKKDGLRGPCKDCKKVNLEKKKKEYNENTENKRTKKVCYDCKKEKDIELFCKDAYKIDGYKTHCKECACNYASEKLKIPEFNKIINDKKRERRKNPEFVKKEREAYKIYYHKPDVLKRKKEYLARPDIKEHYKIYRQINKDRIASKNKEYRNRQIVNELIKIKNKLYHNNPTNKDLLKIKRKSYYNNSMVKERIKSNQKLYRPRLLILLKNKYKNNIDYRVKQITRSRLYSSLKSKKINKKQTTMDYIGCDINFLKLWIEFRFEPNMNWDNWGEVWHLDHILPVNAFNFTKENEIQICNHWTNLQPLYKTENLTKSDNIQLHYYFNNIINVFRFNKKFKQFLGYQVVGESLRWLKIKNFK